MREPDSLAEQLHVLITMDDRTHIITREQSVKIVEAQNTGVKTFSIGNCPITTHQVAGMPTLDVYRRQMKTKLAEKHQRMCKRCGSIVPMADRCPCRESSAPALLEIAAKENPNLFKFLEESGMKQLTMPEPVEPEPLLLPPTPKEREQMKVIQGYKDQFLGKTSAPMQPLPDCSTCKNERQYVFKGVMVKCDCTIRFTKAVSSGTLKTPLTP